MTPTIPPKRSMKIQAKYDKLSKLRVGDYFQLKDRPTSYRHVILLHEQENKTKFTLRTMKGGIFLYREK